MDLGHILYLRRDTTRLYIFSSAIVTGTGLHVRLVVENIM
jgi:hypothetical protein